MAADRHIEQALTRAADLLADADALVIGAGAGLGVDSGLPDFRGRNGFWNAYPALGRARLDFTDIANPAAFVDTPALAWGFYGHRLALYRRTVPHAGFTIARALSASLPHGAFVYTSNVDGQFQKAGFAEASVLEAHGSIHRLQCLDACSERVWSANGFEPEVDVKACLMLNEPPRCPECGGMARPNILMFGDGQWISRVSERQRARFDDWWRGAKRPVVLEMGAGTAVATVRYFSETLAAPLIRINPDASQIGDRQGVSLAMGARDALQGIAEILALKVPDIVP